MDREKVISNLQGVYEYLRHFENTAKMGEWVSDALALLKEQEAIPLQYSETREEYWHYESICPKCGNRWISMGEDHFCPCCGQAVKEGDPDG